MSRSSTSTDLSLRRLGYPDQQSFGNWFHALNARLPADRCTNLTWRLIAILSCFSINKLSKILLQTSLVTLDTQSHNTLWHGHNHVIIRRITVTTHISTPVVLFMAGYEPYISVNPHFIQMWFLTRSFLSFESLFLKVLCGNSFFVLFFVHHI